MAGFSKKLWAPNKFLNITEDDIVDFFLRYWPLEFEPGTRHLYSNFGYFLLGHIVERVSRTPYDRYVLDNIFGRAGICNAYIGGTTPDELRPNEMAYYDDSNLLMPYIVDMQLIRAVGGWVSSPLDMLKLVFTLNDDLDGAASSPRILRSSTIREMIIPPAAVNPGYASGWHVNARGDWWHFGSQPGANSLIHRGVNPRIALVVIMNGRGEDKSFQADFEALRDAVIGAITEWPATGQDIFYNCTTLFDGDTVAERTTTGMPYQGNAGL